MSLEGSDAAPAGPGRAGRWRARAARLLRAAALGLALSVVVVAGGYLMLLRPDIPYATLEARYANSASRFVDLPDGVHLHYRDQGNPAGPPIVLIHGLGGSLQVWEPWVARLGGRYRMVTLDLPGHGLTRAPAGHRASIDSYADLVDGLARRLKLGPTVVVGSSMGGAVAWDDLLRHGADVRALVLVDPAGWPHAAVHRRPPLLFRLLGDRLGRDIVRGIDNRPFAKGNLIKVYHDPAMVTPALVDRFVDLARGPGHREILETLGPPAAEPISAKTFAGVHTPTLVMHGEADEIIPLTDGEALAAAIPGARLVRYPGVGHAPAEQIPNRSAADLADFLNRLPGPETAGP